MARQKVLEAAACIAGEEGISGLTLERVANRAGISKGGLLYHFGTKEEVLAGLVDSLIEEFEAEIRARIETGSSYPEAYVEAAFDHASRERNLFSGLLAAIATDRGMASRLRDRYDDWLKQLEASGLTPARARVVSLAADGLYFTEMIAVAPKSPAERNALKSEILALIR